VSRFVEFGIMENVLEAKRQTIPYRKTVNEKKKYA
jgi:hypothetical protein